MTQKKFLVISMCCVITLFLLNSYALLTSYDVSDNIITFQTGNLKMSINNTEGLMNLVGKLPESDYIGLSNSTPITITLTNTGTMDIMKYEVNLINEVEKEGLDILNDDYIKCAVSLDGGMNYTILGTLGSLNNNIYTGYNLGVSKSKTLYLKLWIDENAGNEALGKTYYGSISVDLYQKIDLDLTTNILNNVEAKKLNNESCNNITIKEDEITYLSGNSECIDFNYVWYSGKLWRVTSINSDRTLKLILANDMTIIPYGANKNFYTNETTKSYVYEWLNEDFLDTLYNTENIIVENALWNASPSNGAISSKLPIEGQEEVLVNASVGLMNSYEYYKSYQNLDSYSKGYLNFGYYRYLLNPYNATTSNVWAVNATGNGQSFAPSSMLSIQPSIVLQSDLLIDGGTGSRNAPFRLKDDKEDIVANSTLLNTRTSGEYVKFGGELFRIVGIENNTTKLNRVDYLKDENEAEVSKMFASSINYGKSDNEKTDEYWDYYLNTTWLKKIDSTYNEEEGTSSILTKGTYYIKTYVSGNYKNAVCNSVSNGTTIKNCEKTTNTWVGYVGLPRYAEMFTGSSSTFTWILTQYNTIRIWCTGNDGRVYNGTPATGAAVRPSINIKSEIVIKSGDGTKQSPFEIGIS